MAAADSVVCGVCWAAAGRLHQLFSYGQVARKEIGSLMLCVCVCAGVLTAVASFATSVGTDMCSSIPPQQQCWGALCVHACRWLLCLMPAGAFVLLLLSQASC